VGMRYIFGRPLNWVIDISTYPSALPYLSGGCLVAERGRTRGGGFHNRDLKSPSPILPPDNKFHYLFSGVCDYHVLWDSRDHLGLEA
jgi:hypothetical protein